MDWLDDRLEEVRHKTRRDAWKTTASMFPTCMKCRESSKPSHPKGSLGEPIPTEGRSPPPPVLPLGSKRLPKRGSAHFPEFGHLGAPEKGQSRVGIMLRDRKTIRRLFSVGSARTDSQTPLTIVCNSTMCPDTTQSFLRGNNGSQHCSRPRHLRNWN
jgi:hypothetical protein